MKKYWFCVKRVSSNTLHGFPGSGIILNNHLQCVLVAGSPSGIKKAPKMPRLSLNQLMGLLLHSRSLQSAVLPLKQVCLKRCIFNQESKHSMQYQTLTLSFNSVRQMHGGICGQHQMLSPEILCINPSFSRH